MSANSRLPWPPWFNFRFTKRNNAALSSRPPQYSILLDSNCLPSRSVTVPEYTRHGHLPVTLSDTFSTSVLLQLPLSAAAPPPIWSCYKTRGDRFGTLQSLNYRDRPEQPFARSACRRETTQTLRSVAWLAVRGAKDPKLPIRTMNYRGKQRFNFPRASTKKNQIWGISSPRCVKLGRRYKSRLRYFIRTCRLSTAST